MPKIYSEEFKATALELLDSGMTQQQVCEDLGLSKSTLQLWVKNRRMTQHGFEPSETVADRAEQTRMLHIRELEQENKVLREAAAYLSQANLKIGHTRPNDAPAVSVTLPPPVSR
ncbi:transposase [Nesterenkonia halobia]|uniref:Transposase n=1 Tax=Nesterenkonia halobia TaxID=37922 RepID=A0ABP6R5N9_9MICC